MAVTLDLMEYATHELAQAAYVASLKYDPNLKLWSKLENAGDVTSPQLGTGGLVHSSPTYPACKFGNGILSDADNEGCTFPTAANNINNSKGTIEFWAKPSFDSEEVDSHQLFMMSVGVNAAITAYYTLGRKIGFVTRGEYIGGRADATEFSFSAGDLIHIAFVWDKDGNDIGGSKTVAIFINGIERASDTRTWSAGTLGADFYVGTANNWAIHSDVVIDNLKTYDHCKLDFSDRDTEDAGHGIQCFSEDTIVKQGSYSLKSIAKATDSLNETLTRTVVPTVDLSNLLHIKFEARASRTGGNFKLRIHDAGGTWSEYTVNILAANIWQTFYWDISAIANANKDAIDSIQILITNADADNLFYLDNIFGDRGGVFITHQ